MECRQALKVRDLVLVRLAGSQALEEDMAFLASHLASCAACRAEAAGIESVWARLGDDDGADLAPSAAFVARTSAALEGASRENVVPFRARPATEPVRGSRRGRRAPKGAGSPARGGACTGGRPRRTARPSARARRSARRT